MTTYDEQGRIRRADGRCAPVGTGPPISSVVAGSLATLLGIPLSRAAALLEEHGSLAGLRRAGPAGLRRSGLTPRRAARLLAALELAAAALTERPPLRERAQVTGPGDAARLLLPEMGLLEREQLRVLLLDTKNRLITAVTLYQGTLLACQVRVAEILAEALRHNAAGLVVAHNHPSGDASPSPEDVTFTRALVGAGQMLDVPVLDHLVVTGNGYTSLRERGLGWD